MARLQLISNFLKCAVLKYHDVSELSNRLNSFGLRARCLAGSKTFIGCQGTDEGPFSSFTNVLCIINDRHSSAGSAIRELLHGTPPIRAGILQDVFIAAFPDHRHKLTHSLCYYHTVFKMSLYAPSPLKFSTTVQELGQWTFSYPTTKPAAPLHSRADVGELTLKTTFYQTKKKSQNSGQCTSCLYKYGR